MTELSSTWLKFLRAYLGVAFIGNFAWEVLHLPLYTIWRTGTTAELIFAVVHCTFGDLLIAGSSLLLALLVFGSNDWPRERFRPVLAATVCIGIGYTVFSEWLNVVVRKSWAYSGSMPVLQLFDFDVGLSPLLQWLVIPTTAFAWAARSTR